MVEAKKCPIMTGNGQKWSEGGQGLSQGPKNSPRVTL